MAMENVILGTRPSVDHVGKLSVIFVTLTDALGFIRVNIQRKLKTVQLKAGG